MTSFAAKRGRGLSSLLISRAGNEKRGIKKRKINEGVAEELKREDDSDEAEDAVEEDLDQFINA